MIFKITKFAVDYDTRECTAVSGQPTFSWAIRHLDSEARQEAYKIKIIRHSTDEVYDTGKVVTNIQHTLCEIELAPAELYTAELTVYDTCGRASNTVSKKFITGLEEWQGKWITTQEKSTTRAKYFTRGFTLTELPRFALLYASGIGYEYLSLNGNDVLGSYLNPAVSNYTKMCYYTAVEVSSALTIGENRLGAIVGNGWRWNEYYMNDWYKTAFKREVEFFGENMFIAELHLIYGDGRREVIASAEDFLAGFGAITENSLFDGEVYDGRCAAVGFDMPSFNESIFEHAKKADDSLLGELRLQTIQPVAEQKRYTAKHIRALSDGSYIFDFGINIAGICELKLSNELPVGTKIVLEHAEEILPNGDLDKETLRKAKCTDVYIAGEERLNAWHPIFNYHGFRYAKLSGFSGIPDTDTLTAISFYNDVESSSYFHCGSAIVNQIQENVVQTERDNLHHIATDCPQRDERMGWMNDATVRFEETPYNFNMGRMFPKILDDLLAEQEADGSIVCTAPRIYGGRPADPVCSSFLVMGLELILHYGNIEALKKYYPAFVKWNECLKGMRTEEGIIEFTRYGDWAGPADYCNEIYEGSYSTVTPGALMSTGYHYYNYKLIARFARLLGYTEDAELAETEAESVRKAFLKKWFKPEVGYIHNGSQGAHAFALWLGLVPQEHEAIIAERMYDAVKNVGYRITTGNLTTRYLMDMLAKYGYTDAAWKIATREEYPSWGYMIQNGATTVWERFEFKRGSGMNSHCHPMYGAVGYWFYAYIAGVKPTEAGWRHFTVKPHIPKELLYAEAKVDTVFGDVYVRWQRQMGKTDILVDVPFGTTATLSLPSGDVALSAGSHSYSF